MSVKTPSDAIPKARIEAVPRSNFRIRVRTVILPRKILGRFSPQIENAASHIFVRTEL
jgi:hypothetical protein